MGAPDCLIVLVVDDFDDARRALAEYLAIAAGCRVETAADGLQALELAQVVKPGVILMDLAMPVMDGAKAVRRLKANPETRDIPIIVITAFQPDDEAPRRALRAGAAEVLTKPVNLQYLEERIRHYCGKPPISPHALS